MTINSALWILQVFNPGGQCLCCAVPQWSLGGTQACQESAETATPVWRTAVCLPVAWGILASILFPEKMCLLWFICDCSGHLLGQYVQGRRGCVRRWACCGSPVIILYSYMGNTYTSEGVVLDEFCSSVQLHGQHVHIWRGCVRWVLLFCTVTWATHTHLKGLC